MALEEHPSVFLVDLKISADKSIKVILDGDEEVNVKDCINISRAIEGALDRDEEDFSLEVASAGVGSAAPHRTEIILGVSVGVLLLLLLGAVSRSCWRGRAVAGSRAGSDDTAAESLLPQGDRAAADTGAGYAVIDGVDYRVIRVVGKGGFGVVYEAERASDGARVAIKYMPNVEEDDVRAGMEEMKALVALQDHPNIMPILGLIVRNESHHDDGDVTHDHTVINGGAPASPASPGAKAASPMDQDHCIIIITPFYADGDLRRYVNSFRAQGKPFPQGKAVAVGVALCDAISFAHEKSVAHRDIKPENVLLAEQKTKVVLTDFGLSKVMEHANETLRTRAGSLPFVAPECFRGSYRKEVDNWSLGCLLFAIATLRVDADNTKMMYQCVGRSDFRDSVVRDLAHYDRRYADVVLGFVKRDPLERLSLAAAKEILLEIQHSLESRHAQGAASP